MNSEILIIYAEYIHSYKNRNAYSQNTLFRQDSSISLMGRISKGSLAQHICQISHREAPILTHYSTSSFDLTLI